MKNIWTAIFSFTLTLAIVHGAVAAPVDVPLVDAVRSGDVNHLRALLAGHVDVNSADGDGTTALHWAAHLDRLESARLLIEAGADGSSGCSSCIAGPWCGSEPARKLAWSDSADVGGNRK